MNSLQKLFGPSKAEIWRQLSTQIGGTYVEGSFWRGDKVEAAHGEWTVTLDTYAVSTGKVTIPFTRMRVPVMNPEGFRFTISRRGFFSDIAKLFGAQDVEIGHPAFDRDFVIKGTDEPKLRALLANATIRALIDAQPEIYFALKPADFFGPKYPAHVDTLEFVVAGVIKDIERLEFLYELFAETLDELNRIRSKLSGSA